MPAASFTVIAPADPPHLDVQQDVSEALASLGPGLAYSRLLRLATGPDAQQPGLRLECELCESWEMRDPTTYVFHLRKDVRWQNIPPVNGRRLTARDLVYSYERQRTPGWPNAALLQSVDTFQAQDDNTLVVKLKYADADLPLYLADGHSKIVAREAVEKTGDLRAGPVVGTGPWLWRDTKNGVGTTLVANERYFEQGLPKAGGMTITVVQDEEAQLAAYATGVADVYRVPADMWEEYQRAASTGSEVRASTYGGAGVTIVLNASKPPFDSADVRRAAFAALDPWAYAHGLWADGAWPSVGIPLAGPDWALPQTEMTGYFANAERGKDLLYRATGATTLGIELTVADFGDAYLRLAERVQSDLRGVGIESAIRQVDPREYASKTLPGRDFQMLVGALPPASTPNGFLFPLLYSGGRFYISGQTDTELDSLIDRQSAEADPAARGAIVRDIQRRVLDQAYMFTPLTEMARWAYRPSKLSDFYPNNALSEYAFWARVGLGR